MSVTNLVLLLFLIFSLLLSGCYKSNHTGFLPGSYGCAPISETYHDESTMPELSLEDPSERVIIIYNHGTTDPAEVEDCGKCSNRVPDSLKAVQGENLLIYYLCSKKTEQSRVPRVGEYIDKRVRELNEVIGKFLSMGVNRNHIFLAGHSAGGWASLMAMLEYRHKFNSAIVFAPAFAGTREERDKYPEWARAREEHIKKLTMEGKRVEALVFAYFGDQYEDPYSLQFLEERYPDTVRLEKYGCKIFDQHLTHLYDCREDQTVSIISDYLESRL